MTLWCHSCFPLIGYKCLTHIINEKCVGRTFGMKFDIKRWPISSLLPMCTTDAGLSIIPSYPLKTINQCNIHALIVSPRWRVGYIRNYSNNAFIPQWHWLFLLHLSKSHLAWLGAFEAWLEYPSVLASGRTSTFLTDMARMPACGAISQ